MHIYTSHLWRRELREEKKIELDTCSSAVTFYGLMNSTLKKTEKEENGISIVCNFFD
jgi:hypothetical protein